MFVCTAQAKLCTAGKQVNIADRVMRTVGRFTGRPNDELGIADHLINIDEGIQSQKSGVNERTNPPNPKRYGDNISAFRFVLTTTTWQVVS